MITFRAFEPTPDHYDAVVAVHNAVWTDYPRTAAEVRHREETRDPKHVFQRWLGSTGDAIVATGAYGDTPWSQQPGKYFMSIDVLPQHRRQGIGGAFYEHLMAHLAAKNPSIIVSGTREHYVDSIRFLENREFVQEMREPVSELELARFDWAKFEGARERVAQQGIVIRTLAELSQSDPVWKRKLYDLEQPLAEDIPSPDPITHPPFEEYEKQIFADPNFNPDAHFVALDGDRWVGYSMLMAPGAAREKLFTGLTGVLRSHRRRGIARALKLRAIEFAQEFGAKTITTDNEENNPMFRLNLQLGFEPRPAWLTYRKTIQK